MKNIGAIKGNGVKRGWMDTNRTDGKEVSFFFISRGRWVYSKFAFIF